MRPILAATALALLAAPALAATPAEVVATYAEIGEAAYGDSLLAAKALQAAVESFLAAPSAEGLEAARDAWRAARASYVQTEAFRFGNPVVDDWEPRVNSWPLDEGLIDYVDPATGGATDENALAALDVVANPRPVIDGQEVDATAITPALLADALNGAEGVEANVARGYHAVEFLLWGQDLNGFDVGAGERPWTDYAQGAACTHGNCDRRADFLRSATDLLVDDLSEMASAWEEGGAARAAVTDDPQAGLAAMLTGLGSLSYGELAGERMRLGLMLNDPEEEQDCFSDNTQASHLGAATGIRNVWLGQYRRLDGSVVEGPSLRDLVAEAEPALADETTAKVEASVAALQALSDRVAQGLAYDSMLAPGEAEGEALIGGAVDRLIDQTRSFERVLDALGIGQVAFEGSDSLDSADAVFQ